MNESRTVATDYVYVSLDLSRVWHIARRDDVSLTLCGLVLNAHGAPGWPRTVETLNDLYGQYPAVCKSCNGKRPLPAADGIRVGATVRRASPREPQNLGVVQRILPPNGYCRVARAKVEWQNATRRFSGSTHTTSTVSIDRLILADAVSHER